MEFSTKFLEYLVVKLLAIIGNEDIWKFESIDNVFIQEVFNFALGDVRQGFCLHPFGDVVDGDDEKLLTSC